MAWLKQALAAAALAAFSTAFSGDLPHSPYTDIAVATVEVAGLLLLGWYVGWSSLWIFSVALVAATVIHQGFLWHDDPRISGIDDIGPTGLILGLPPAWAVLALAAAARASLTGSGASR